MDDPNMQQRQMLGEDGRWRYGRGSTHRWRRPPQLLIQRTIGAQANIGGSFNILLVVLYVCDKSDFVGALKTGETALHAAGEHTISELEELFSITRSTVYRALARGRARAAT